MSKQIRVLLSVLMPVALVFGFLHHLVSDFGFDFERLHIFLFNLCSGGTVILFHTERRFSPKVALFLVLSLVYAVLVFFEIYWPAVIISLLLAGIVELIRMTRFSWFPFGFFQWKEPVQHKFHQASLLCLSMGLVISSLVIVNNEFMHWVSMPKLQLNTFFLGFSFPVSLITMSVIFGLIDEGSDREPQLSSQWGFWSVNLGVIIFFVFIIFEILMPQLIVTLILFSSVIMILVLFHYRSRRVQQKAFLTSGMAFLLVTAVSGILYIILAFSPDYETMDLKLLLKLHAFASLYGWNLCGLAVISRSGHFPIRLNTGLLILVHWITVILFAPLGNYHPIFALLAVLGFAFITYVILFSPTGSAVIRQSD
jgi:hypothetical protein